MFDIPSLFLGTVLGFAIGTGVLVWAVGHQLGLRFFEPPNWKALKEAALLSRARAREEK